MNNQTTEIHCGKAVTCHVKTMNALYLTYVPPGHLHSGVPVDIRQQAQTETLRVGWICESVNGQRGLGGVKGLADTLVQLIIGYRAPEGWF